MLYIYSRKESIKELRLITLAKKEHTLFIGEEHETQCLLRRQTRKASYLKERNKELKFYKGENNGTQGTQKRGT